MYILWIEKCSIFFFIQ